MIFEFRKRKLNRFEGELEGIERMGGIGREG